jgi:hypothetical protein
LEDDQSLVAEFQGDISNLLLKNLLFLLVSITLGN